MKNNDLFECIYEEAIDRFAVKMRENEEYQAFEKEESEMFHTLKEEVSPDLQELLFEFDSIQGSKRDLEHEIVFKYAFCLGINFLKETQAYLDKEV